ncbi:MAG: RusA family crossover junction endodeoxyribonuclease [Erysipelotrichaceae bacterium]|nr:RusA family crossover junction endodeoxyribonuclease [Erysipelotrichaceae bacterium]
MVGKKPFMLNLNTYRNAHYQILNQAKKNFKELLKPQLYKLPILGKITIHYTIYYKDKRKFDLDNIVSVIAKFTQDALVENEIIEEDNYTIVIGSSNSFGGISKDNPRCQITITEV